MKKLVIVESPTKARTISKFLGDGYDIKYSMGHIIDLPKSKLGVAIENKFLPEYEVLTDKKKIIAELKSAAKNAELILLATDPDREGEAISANIQELLTGTGKQKIAKEKFKRIVFHEITETAIKEALEHPRHVNQQLVDAQTARRVLDRLVGYQLSPLLWQKVRRGLSAGRVQSVALRLIVEREREIEKFTKEQYWTIHAQLVQQSGGKAEFELISINDKRIEVQQTFPLYDGEYKSTKTIIDAEKKAQEISDAIKAKTFIVAEVNEREAKRSPSAPYTTSTLQQDASRRYGYPGRRTMSLAQKLYEEGYITYHRTDSTTLSASAITAIRSYITDEYGEKYLPGKGPRVYATKQKNAQEAHEGIRPTKFTTLASHVATDLGNDCAKLYDLIWKRTVASQMADAIMQQTTIYSDSVQSAGDTYRMKANGSVLVFDGFLKLTPLALQDTRLPKFTAQESLSVGGVRNERHETPPPPRYNDASLIATLEEKSIGRPSTYASIVSTLVDRAYVERAEKRFVPTSIGAAVNDFLVMNFSSIDDVPFTAQMENDLDAVADGKKDWVTMMQDFYTPFAEKIGEVKGAARVKIAVEETDQKCPDCGQANLVIRTGRFGKFLSCARFPECKFTKPFVEETNVLCPKDGGKVIIKKTKKGRKFYGCSNYPNCDFAAWKLEDIKKEHPTSQVSEKATG